MVVGRRSSISPNAREKKENPPPATVFSGFDLGFADCEVRTLPQNHSSCLDMPPNKPHKLDSCTDRSRGVHPMAAVALMLHHATLSLAAHSLEGFCAYKINECVTLPADIGDGSST